MDLLEIVDPNFGLIEDINSGLKFGKFDQLTIIGWSGKYRSTKYYILICDVCKKDPEIYGDGYFRSTLPNLRSGRIPCGCAVSRSRPEREVTILAKRSCEAKGLSFLGWDGDFIGILTKCRINCPIHGEYKTTSLNSLLNQDNGCRACADERASIRMFKEDEDWACKFLNTGSFHPDTIFSRSDCLNNQGRRTLWNFECPVCDWKGLSDQANLAAGKIPCECSIISKMTNAYINLISDGETDIAIKFGITSRPERRLKMMQSKCVYEVSELGVWGFEEFFSCRKAETILKNTLVCGIIPRSEMEDGFSETTNLSNLEQIVKTYEEYGGVRIR